jgi:hypothetical protein
MRRKFLDFGRRLKPKPAAFPESKELQIVSWPVGRF